MKKYKVKFDDLPSLLFWGMVLNGNIRLLNTSPNYIENMYLLFIVQIVIYISLTLSIVRISERFKGDKDV